MRRILRSLVLVASVVALGCAGGDGESTSLEDGSLGGDDGVIDSSPIPPNDTAFNLDGSGCKPKTCSELGANCGPMADGCGGLLASCGSCTAPEFCGGGGASKCGIGETGCVAKTCADLGATCGKQGDGCGRLIDCGTCTPPATCGGGGVPNKCGSGALPDGGTCVPKTCAAMGYDCGPVADGCAGLVDCGTCPTGTACGIGGKPNVCGTSIAPCVKKTCADLGANCGPISDGCGGLTASCGTCTGLETCGGGSVPSKCGGAPACVKKTCADYPGTCGQQTDGCGGLTVSCGTCASPLTCGGGGTPSKCGGAPACIPKTCAAYPGTCGQQPDGCGGLTTSCGSCTAPQTCGGGGVPSTCGGPPPCVPKTCAGYPAGTCGPVSDGCGGLTVSCGTCTSPKICGGGGVPSACGGGGGTTCVNLQCKQVTCAGTATTSISGVVYDPAGIHPLPNVNVYVPNAAVAPLTSGATCDPCSAGLSGVPLVKTTTDVNGKFKLDDMPVDTNVPVVIQLGKWRRQIKVTTTACTDVVVAAGLTRFPRNKSEGDIPKIALSTGGADPLECLLRKIGIDDAEFTNPSGTGRVNLYAGGGGSTKAYSGGATFPLATQLWNQLDPSPAATPPIYGLKAYDVTLLSCEALSKNTTPDFRSNKPDSALIAMQQYVNGGGRVFGSHYHYVWMYGSSTLAAPYDAWASMVSWNTTNVTLSSPTQETVLTSFPKALTMNQWMQSPGVLAATVVPPAPAPSRFPVNGGRRSIVSITDPSILLWIQTTTSAYPQYFSFDTPVGAAAGAACGRFVFSDIHVASGDSTGPDFPTGCTTSKTSMSAQEAALEFMFFDLASPVCGGTTPPPTCTPTTCAAMGFTCGSAPDGCGGTIASCGTCTPPSVCSTGGKCASSSCTPATCVSLGFTCGSWADGCGGTLDCGTCTAGTCGGGGFAGKCGGPSCSPTTCATLGYDCGAWPDGCGATLACGTCTPPASCGGAGVAGKCGSVSCTPTTCAALGYSCGSWADGCGGALSCGVCTPPSVCGASTPGKCDTSSCTPKTCAELGVKCGPSGDGCGGTIDCGACPPGGCVPLTCGGRCGPQGDGCGGILSCPACPGGVCVPTTCAAAGAECGPYPDGCGGLLSCGTCVAPTTCGGSGVPNKCGGVR
jgi:hypothetical protein